MPTTYKTVYIIFYKKDAKIYNNFRNRILFRDGKYPGFLPRNVPFLTQREIGYPDGFLVNGVKFDNVIILPEFIIPKLEDELKKIDIIPLIDIYTVDVFSINFELRMSAMERFWKYYTPEGSSPFSKHILRLVAEIKLPSSQRSPKKEELRNEILKVFNICEKIKELDWTREKSWDQEPEFYKIIESIIYPLYEWLYPRSG